jgi:surfeit locus 1 family protein
VSTSPGRRIALLGIAVVVAAVCVRLGLWQLDRLEERRATNTSIERGLAEPPADLATLLAETDDPGSLAYRRVTVTGTYDAGSELVLYGRALDGSPGDHVLTPLVMADRASVLVDRGWIPYEPDRSAPVDPPAAAPRGTASVEGVLLPSEAGAAFSEGADARLVRAVNVPQIDERLDTHELAPVYLLLQAQDPAQEGGLPIPAEVPEPTEGPHLSYAIQWFSFATIAVVGYVVLARRDRRDRHRPDDTPREDMREG